MESTAAENGHLARTLSRWELLAIGLGAVIGWSWVIYSGIWSSDGGTLGGSIAFVVCGLLCSFVGLVYAELTSAFPRAGGEVVFVFEGIGEKSAIAVSWGMILLWGGLVVIETLMFPVILEGFGLSVPQFGKLYSIGGSPVFLSYLLISLVGNAVFAYINLRGAKISGVFQTVAVAILLVAALFFAGSGVLKGSPQNAKPLFGDLEGLALVFLMVPGFLSGFNAIPQASEETTVSGKNMGRLVVYTVWGSVLFYVIIIVGLGFAADLPLRSGEGLVVIDAVNSLFNGSSAARVFVTFAALMGMLTTWNAAYMAGSRLIMGLARARFIPEKMAYIHPRHKTPSRIIAALFVLSTAFCLLGTSKSIYVGIVNIFSLFLVVTWLLVCISFLRLRSLKPRLDRPYRVPAGKIVGWIATVFSAAYILVYTPLSPGGLSWGEWLATGIIVLAMLATYFAWNIRKGYLSPEERRRRLVEAP